MQTCRTGSVSSETSGMADLASVDCCCIADTSRRGDQGVTTRITYLPAYVSECCDIEEVQITASQRKLNSTVSGHKPSLNLAKLIAL